ncbi:MAG: RuvX/YqgF family protein [bacterium]|nr:RuvX/YqgF family protein [bacterium]
MVILGVDYGSVKVGLAIAAGLVAAPLRVVPAQDARFLREELRRAIVEYDVGMVVVGMPKEDRERVEAFVAWLRRELTQPVVVEDEQLTTQFAKRLMRGWKGKAEDDAIAAALIAQTYIERSAEGM